MLVMELYEVGEDDNNGLVDVHGRTRHRPLLVISVNDADPRRRWPIHPYPESADVR
jgi:hypothetical protein